MLRKTLMGGLVLSISMLVACGDDDSFVPKPTGLPDEVADLDQLEAYECSDEIIGERVYVKNLEVDYECDGDHWFETVGQIKSSSSSKKTESSSSEASSSSAKSSSSSSVPESSSSEIESSADVSVCDAMDKSDVSTWHFVGKDVFGDEVEYTYIADGRDLIVKIRDSEGSVQSNTYTMYNMESEVGVEMAYRAALATCEDVTSGGDEPESSSSALADNEFIDSRDGQVYKTTVIGGDIWMAQNLNFAYTEPTADEDSSSFCYNGLKSNCDKYGRLYIWSAAMDSAGIFSDDGKGCGNKSKTCDAKFPARGVCPEGWHLPSAQEYEDLLAFVGAEPDAENYWEWKDAGIPLKSNSGWKSWSGVTTPTDEFGFSVLPSGEKNESGEKYYEMGEYSYFNTSTSDTTLGTLDFAFFVKFSYARDYVEVLSTNKRYARPVRCKKN